MRLSELVDKHELAMCLACMVVAFIFLEGVAIAITWFWDE
jgi:hypothetical protein